MLRRLEALPEAPKQGTLLRSICDVTMLRSKVPHSGASGRASRLWSALKAPGVPSSVTNRFPDVIALLKVLYILFLLSHSIE